jgi:AhpD family alkylhydroperoxidase
MADELPQPYQDFTKQYPKIAEAYEALGSATHEAGPLDDRTRRLIKLAIAVGGRLEGAVRAHARQAKAAGVSDEEIDHVVLLAMTTIGLPSTVAARTWVMDALSEA